ncbi:MAG: DUF502 domain-containing protein [Kiritimatiellae bacterium]|nr:DUF502 domain-containing protein [Kiritimatiellia bacterium]
MKTLGSLLIKGLSAILPVSVVVFFIYWIGATAEHALGELLKAVLPDRIYLPGMGLLAGLILAIGVGLLLNLWLFQRMVDMVEGWLARVPLVKTLLGGIKDLMAFLAKGNKKNTGKKFVVRVDLGNDIRMLGIMTRQDLDEKGSETFGEGRCAVYLPMSYQMGGYTLYLPRSMLSPIDMSVEDAIRFAITAGMSGEKKLKSVPPATGQGVLS